MPGPEEEVTVLTDASDPDRDAKSAQIDKPLYGILFLIATAAVQACADGAAKYLAQSLPVIEISWLRYISTVAAVLVALKVIGFRDGLRTTRPGFQFVRGFLLVISGLVFLFALRSAPIVDVTATIFSAPLMVTALSIALLGERVGPRRWLAAIVGLAGVLIVMRPGSSVFNPALLWAVLAALLFAFGLVMTRKISGNERPIATMAYSAIIGLAVLTVVVPFAWVTPTWTEAAIALAVGLIYASSQWFTILAYRYADASVLAPYSYFQIVFIAAIGIVFFREVPDIWTVIGIAIIVASGLYTAQYERLRRAGLRRAKA